MKNEKFCENGLLIPFFREKKKKAKYLANTLYTPTLKFNEFHLRNHKLNIHVQKINKSVDL